jgi:hypothetical protein
MYGFALQRLESKLRGRNRLGRGNSKVWQLKDRKYNFVCLAE